MARLLSEAEQERMRDDIEAMCMPDTCNILTATNTPDGYGGQTVTWGTTYSKVKCRLDAYKGKEFVIGGQVQPFHGYVLTMPSNTTITTSNRVEVGTATTKYAVIGVDGAERSWAITVRAALEVI